MKHTKQKIQRRTFMQGGAIAGAAIGVGIPARAIAGSIQETPRKAAAKGYHETDHIREYYRLARF